MLDADDRPVYADSGLLSHINRVVGVSINSAAMGESFFEIQYGGEIKDPSFNFTPGPIYVGENGFITTVLPTDVTAEYLQQIGIATNARHHPGESVFRAVFTTIGVIICGAPMWLVMLYQSLSAVLSQFNHANMRLPLWLDNAISWIIISPNMHKVHHHYKQPQTDSNYGNIFSIWDRLFGTYNYTPVDSLRYGLDVLDDSTDEQLNYQLKFLSTTQ